jgi:hypothetical protein
MKIDGKQFHLYNNHHFNYKMSANKKAFALRDEGYKARVIKDIKGYGIWIRK